MTTTTDKLATTIADTGIERDKAKSIWVQFEEFFEGVSECAEKVDGLEITDVTQKAEMRLARATRLELKNIRVAAEKTKKSLKANILREGRFIDATYRLIADATKPVEADLLEKENYAKRLEAERIARLIEERTAVLGEYGADTRFIRLEELTDDAFAQLVEKSRTEHEERLEAVRIAEDERLARVRAEAEERARLADEMERMRQEREAREAEIAEELARAEEARLAAEAVARQEREAREAVERAERERLAEEERRDREARDRELRELREKELAEENRKRQLQQADDKEKLSAYVSTLLAVEAPSLISHEASMIAVRLAGEMFKARDAAESLDEVQS